MNNSKSGILKWTLNIIVAILTYLFLVIDRIMLVPFVFVSSYSAKELALKPDRFSSYAIIRVGIAVILIIIYIIIKLL